MKIEPTKVKTPKEKANYNAAKQAAFRARTKKRHAEIIDMMRRHKADWIRFYDQKPGEPRQLPRFTEMDCSRVIELLERS